MPGHYPGMGLFYREAEAAAWARLQRYAQQVAALLRGA